MALQKHKRGSSYSNSHTVTKAKAKTILREDSIRGKKLTKKQKGFFGARAGGTPIKRVR